MTALDDAEDLMADISIEDLVKNLPRAATATEFEASGGGRNMLDLKSAEVQLRSPRPLKCWRRLRESGGLSSV